MSVHAVTIEEIRQIAASLPTLLHPIRTDEDFERIQASIGLLLAEGTPAEGSPEENLLLTLTAIIAEYESHLDPMPDATPLEVIQFVMETNDYTPTDLGDVLGSRSRAYEVLNGSRDLSKAMINRLHDAWRIPKGALL